MLCDHFALKQFFLGVNVALWMGLKLSQLYVALENCSCFSSVWSKKYQCPHPF